MTCMHVFNHSTDCYSHSPCRTLLCTSALLSTDDGTERLDWVEFAQVVEEGEDYVLQYIDGENESTTWPSEELGGIILSSFLTT